MEVMKLSIHVALFSFLIFILSLTTAHAVPVEISYQGYLTDTGGVPAEGTKNITFRIYNVDAGPVEDSIWMEQQTVDVAKGVYSVVLGEDGGNLIDPAIFSDQLWLGIEVETAGEMVPRQKLTAAPYSINAQTAETANSVQNLCRPGDYMNCYSGVPFSTLGVGECRGGYRECLPSGDGFSDTCENEVLPSSEICDGKDNDCNPGTADGIEDPSGGLPCDGPDADLCQEGTYTGCSGGALVCSDTSGDTLEICDDVDNNCDGYVDEGCDDDNDNYCDIGMSIVGTPSTCTFGGGDCNDTVASLNPGALEICDDVDNNCDGYVDEGCDDDNDDYCDSGMAIIGTPSTCSLGGGDCDDTITLINPGATEICDGVDNDCDDSIDEGCNQLFISEYVDVGGGSPYGAIELFNPEVAPVNLGICNIRIYQDGNPSPFYTVSINPVQLGPNQSYVICHPGFINTGPCDELDTSLQFTGNDAIELYCSGAAYDIFGQIGFNPGSGGWGIDPVNSVDNTLRRKCGIITGDAISDDPFDPSLEWDGFPANTITDLGTHCGM